MSRLINNSEKLSDEQWFNLVASLLNGWFVFEREFVHPQSQTLIEMLSERKLLNIQQGLRQ
ncbi:MAG: phage DNA packaging protein C [Aeromonadaceae bacterium]